MRKISVSFRIYSETISPAGIDDRVGLRATEVWERGEPRGGRALDTNIWEFEIDYGETDELDDVVARTLEALSPARDRIAGLPGVERVFWCAVFSDTPETTVSLKPSTLHEMAVLRAEFSCSVYASSFDDEASSL